MALSLEGIAEAVVGDSFAAEASVQHFSVRDFLQSDFLGVRTLYANRDQRRVHLGALDSGTVSCALCRRMAVAGQEGHRYFCCRHRAPEGSRVQLQITCLLPPPNPLARACALARHLRIF